MNHQIKKFFQLTEGPAFLPFFCALFVARYFLIHLDLTLTGFPGEMIGIATLHAVDIAKRVNLLYWGIGIFTVTLIFVNGLIRLIEVRFPDRIPPAGLLNVLSVAGIFLVLIAFFNEAAGLAVNALFTVILLVWLQKFFQPAIMDDEAFANRVATMLIWSVGLAFLLREMLLFSGKSSGHYITDYLLYCGLATVLFQRIIPRPKNVHPFKSLLIWMAGFPLITVLSEELRWFLFHRFEATTSIEFLFPILVLGSLAFWVILNRVNPDFITIKRCAFLLFGGLIVFAFYTPVIPQPKEMFELANPTLGLSRLFEFGEIPVLETFNSHLLFELLFGFLYSVIHGFRGLEFITFDFLHQVLFYVIAFFFLRRWTHNDYLTLAALLFFPLLYDLFPMSFAVVLLPIFAIDHWLGKASFRSRIWLLSTLLALILWKIDLGYGAVLATLLLIIILWISRKAPFDILGFLKAGIWIALPIGIVTAVIVLVKGIPLAGHLKQALHYLSSAQTYGYHLLAREYDPLFFAHYLLFPAIIWIGFLAILYQLNKYLSGRRFETISLVFLSLFYLFNFHRGLIRHGFMEYSDQWLSSFAFFIVPAMMVFFFLHNKSRKIQSLSFFSGAFFMIIAFNFPAVSHPCFFAENLQLSFGNEGNGNLDKGRLIGSEAFEKEKLEDLREFFDSHLEPTKTFYDYSNSPMLYAYLHRKVPSYFNQMLLSMHDEYLQQCVIDSIESQQIPFIVYSNFPENWFDRQDEVPKDVRHYHLGEYLHRHFEPLAIVNDYTIWKRKEMDLLPDTVSVEFTIDSLNNALSLRSEQPGHYKIWMRTESYDNLQIELDGSIYPPDYSLGKTKYYHLESEDFEQRLTVKNRSEDSSSIKIYRCSYYPDEYSNRDKNYNLIRLPEIWAENFEESGFESVALHPRTDSSERFVFELPEHIDKRRGNFISVEGFTGDRNFNDCEMLMMDGEHYLGTFRFLLNEEGENNRYLIRISSQYNWNQRPDRLVIRPNHYLAKIKAVRLLTPIRE